VITSTMPGAALVTGAGSGIGRAASVALAAAGFDVHVLDVDEGALKETAAIVEKQGRCVAHTCDVTDPDQVDDTVLRAHDERQRLDVVVNNAGVYQVDDLLELSYANWRRVLAVNADGTFLVSQAAARRMVTQPVHPALQRRGMVINISSVAAEGGRPNRTAYGASKALVRHLTMSQAMAWREHEVAACLVYPGEVFEGMLQNVYQRLSEVTGRPREELIEGAQRALPRQQFQTAAEVAQRITFLATTPGMSHSGTVLWCDSHLSAI
jgi:NAD(P)-dependent dehydrogenase (short-subunit alcohol dehydrogenase family)